MGALAGHVVAIVGAAEGIGRAAASALAADGATVACLDRNEEGAHVAAAELGDRAVGARLDVTDVDAVVSVIDGLERQQGRIDALVNCAGTTGRTGLKSHEVDPADFDAVYRVNLFGAFLLSRAVVPGMVARGYGRVLHVASIAGKEGNAGMTAYSATKAGLIGMVKAQGKEYADTGVTINALAPAVIETAMVAAMPEQQVRYMTDRIPMGRCGTLEEAAEAIRWIVSPATSFTTGFTFDLSGGRAVY
ncbi:SDR family oxidoreductase [Egibacter rhizosphaerae]|uniref:SDR family oxidoreductase n=1 Tax=Egibacter rhizosphaerae TaxID=1670831 RepID=A0A411YLQ9_9ACTN|nr:SDR family oxidoreductase [Egibacter rhizosphaerae]